MGTVAWLRECTERIVWAFVAEPTCTFSVRERPGLDRTSASVPEPCLPGVDCRALSRMSALCEGLPVNVRGADQQGRSSRPRTTASAVSPERLRMFSAQAAFHIQCERRLHGRNLRL